MNQESWENVFNFFNKNESNKGVEIGMGIWLSEKNLDIEKKIEKYRIGKKRY
jgi:hypothetical protein